MARVLITGCNSGFGLGAARKLAERGDTVYATARDPDNAHDLHALCARGLPITIIKLDVRDEAAARRAVETVISEGGIDALVNNAGVSMFAAVEEVSVNLVKEMMEVNLYGPLRLMQFALPAMRAQGHGRIVNVSSGAGRVPLAYMSTYCMTKHALDVLSFCIASELAQHGIKVSVISPGAFKTAVGGKLWVPDIAVDGPPYRKIAEQMDAGWHATVEGNGHDPNEVSEAIAAAVHDENPPIRQYVGVDVRAMAQMLPELSDDQWLASMAPGWV